MITLYEETFHNYDHFRGVPLEKISYFMKMAKNVQEFESPCLSRQIGVVIMDPHNQHAISWGHNGPPDDTPPCDDEDYLRNVVWPQLTVDERKLALQKAGRGGTSDIDSSLRNVVWPPTVEEKTDRGDVDCFVRSYANCGTCPRRIVGARSGQRLELCTCAHGETNAIVKAHRDVSGCWMFCYCGVPCIDCTKLIINSRIALVFAIDHGMADYSPYSSRWLFEKSNTELVMAKEDWYFSRA